MQSSNLRPAGSVSVSGQYIANKLIDSKINVHVCSCMFSSTCDILDCAPPLPPPTYIVNSTPLRM